MVGKDVERSKTEGFLGGEATLSLGLYVAFWKQNGTPDSNLVDSASSIRLSQRLSHACLSINNFIRETANGSLYQL